MNISEIVIQYANRFDEFFSDDRQPINDAIQCTENEPQWINRRYTTNRSRYTHIEQYVDSKYSVLHVTSFPRTCYDAPIFGFDLVGVNRAEKFTAAFLDLSGEANQSYFNSSVCTFGKPHRIPNWGDIFSPSFVCIVPDMDQVILLLNYALKIFSDYWNMLLACNPVSDEQRIADRQTRYCSVQSQNPKTFSVLKAKIGEDNARQFMENILFPWPSTNG
jgi:hypothetical protein